MCESEKEMRRGRWPDKSCTKDSGCRAQSQEKRSERQQTRRRRVFLILSNKQGGTRIMAQWLGSASRVRYRDFGVRDLR
jgi:hypothetical protein